MRQLPDLTSQARADADDLDRLANLIRWTATALLIVCVLALAR